MGISSALGSSALLPAGLGFRNVLINGDFRINQRGFTSVTGNGYGFDRWVIISSTGTVTHSPQTFTVGNAIPNQEPQNFARVVTTGQTSTSGYAIFVQRIEGVRTFAGQTASLSFWAKASSGTPKIAVELEQVFGTGGSSVVQTYVGQTTISTSWVRYTFTFVVPSISGKTIGTNDSLNLNLWVSGGSDYNSRTGSIGVQSNTFDFWGVQFEQNYQPTPFERRPIGTELALCQRYYYRIDGIANAYTLVANGGVCSAGAVSRLGIFLPVSMRTTTITANDMSYNALLIWDGTNLPSVSAIGGMWNTLQTASIDMSVSSAILTAGRPGQALLNGAGFFAINLEL